MVSWAAAPPDRGRGRPCAPPLSAAAPTLIQRYEGGRVEPVDRDAGRADASLQAIALQDIQRRPLAHAAHESLVASALAIRPAAVARPAFTVSRLAAGPVRRRPCL